MEKVASYIYNANAIYVAQSLAKDDILANVIENRISNEIHYEIFVQTNQASKAKELIAKMEIDDSLVDQDSEGYISGNEEWASNRFNPGYYTGGKTPHFLLDKSNWKFLLPFYLIGGVYFIFRLTKYGFRSFDLMDFFWGALYLIAGISLISQISKKRK